MWHLWENIQIFIFVFAFVFVFVFVTWPRGLMEGKEAACIFFVFVIVSVFVFIFVFAFVFVSVFAFVFVSVFVSVFASVHLFPLQIELENKILSRRLPAHQVKVATVVHLEYSSSYFEFYFCLPICFLPHQMYWCKPSAEIW